MNNNEPLAETITRWKRRAFEMVCRERNHLPIRMIDQLEMSCDACPSSDKSCFYAVVDLGNSRGISFDQEFCQHFERMAMHLGIPHAVCGALR